MTREQIKARNTVSAALEGQPIAAWLEAVEGVRRRALENPATTIRFWLDAIEAAADLYLPSDDANAVAIECMQAEAYCALV